MRKDLNKIAKTARAQGWKIVQCKGSNHHKWYPPDGGPFVVVPWSPASNNRSFQNVVALLRRAGLEI